MLWLSSIELLDKTSGRSRDQGPQLRCSCLALSRLLYDLFDSLRLP
jgi:hypothetical protein